MQTDWQAAAEEAIKNAPLQQNDYLVAQLLGFMPIPEVLISEWIPGNKLIEAVKNPYITDRDKVKLLDRLGRSPVAEDSLYAAASSLTSISTLELLAGDTALPIRNIVKDRNNEFLNHIIATIASQQKIAANWDTIPEELVKLADSKWNWIRQTVASNPFTPQDTLAKLARDESAVIQLAVARNYGTSGEVLDLLLDDYDEEVGRAISIHPNASEKALLRLLPYYFQQFIYYRNKFLPAAVLAELFQYSNNYDNDEPIKHTIQSTLIRDENTSGEILAKLTNSSSKWIEYSEWVKDLVRHSNILVETLEELAKNPNPKIILAVFESSKISDSLRTQLLDRLLNSRDYTIRLDLALSSQTPNEIRNRLLEELVNAQEADLQIIEEENNTNDLLDDEDEYKIKIKNIWQKIAESENTPAFILDRMARIKLLKQSTINHEGNKTIALALISNPNTPKDTRNKLKQQLLKFANNPNDNLIIYFALARNPAISKPKRENYFKKIINSKQININEYVFGFLARNPKTPPKILQLLSEKDSESRLERALAINPSTPASILKKIANLKITNYRYTHEDLLLNSSTTPEDLVKVANHLSLKSSNSRFQSYSNWSLFWMRFSNVPRLEVYKILLAKEQEEIDAKDSRLIQQQSSTTPQLITSEAEKKAHRLRLAINVNQNQPTPTHILEDLVKDEDVDIRIAVSKNPNLPLNCLLELARDDNPEVRNSLFWYWQNRETHPEVLAILATDEVAKIRQRVACYHQTAPETLKILAKDSNLEVRQEVSKNRKTPVETLEYLWHTEKLFNPDNHNFPSYIVAEVISNTSNSKQLYKILERFGNSYPQVPAEVLVKLASHQDAVVRSRVADRIDTPSHILEQLADDDYSLSRCCVASNPNTPLHVLDRLIEKWEYENNENKRVNQPLCRRIAERKDAPPHILNYLAKSKDGVVRDAAMNNPNIPISTLVTMLFDEEKNSVLEYLVKHPDFNSEVTARLIQYPNIKFRLAAIDERVITPKQWYKLAQDKSEEVRKQIAWYSNMDITRHTLRDNSYVETTNTYPDLTFELWQKLAEDTNTKVRVTVSANSSTPIILLEQLASDMEARVLEHLIENPNTPQQLHKSLKYRLHVANNPTLRGLSRIYNPKSDDLATLLSEYVQSDVLFVRFVSLMHPLIPIECLENKYQSNSWLERYAVAINSTTPKEIKQYLTEDNNPIVQAAALNG